MSGRRRNGSDFDGRACRKEPDRWLDPRQRRHALAGCLGCPVRRMCAQRALDTAAPYGMWAGIWIDGRLDEVAVHYLRAIASDTDVGPRALRARELATPPPPMPSISGIVLARSSGHCEVMATRCSLTLDAVLRRYSAAGAPASPSEAFAACGPCDAALVELPTRALVRLGYQVETAAAAPLAPFFWRQCRWVRLDPTGALPATRPTVAA